MNTEQQIMNNEYKQMFDAILENNLAQLQNLENVAPSQDGEDKNKARKALERQYNNIRFKVRCGQPLTAGEILYLGTATNLSLINLKKRLDYQRRTIEIMENNIAPIFSGLTTVPSDINSDGGNVLVEEFYSKVAGPLSKEEKAEETLEQI